jgi:hypothetical protein
LGLFFCLLLGAILFSAMWKKHSGQGKRPFRLAEQQNYYRFRKNPPATCEPSLTAFSSNKSDWRWRMKPYKEQKNKICSKVSLTTPKISC